MMSKSEAESWDELRWLVDVSLQALQVVCVSVARGNAHGGGGRQLRVDHEGDVGRVDVAAGGDSGVRELIADCIFAAEFLSL